MWYRTIHMNADADNSTAPFTLGHTVGRWQNGTTLLITTYEINWPYFIRVGVPQSEAVEVWERFIVDDDAGRSG